MKFANIKATKDGIDDNRPKTVREVAWCAKISTVHQLNWSLDSRMLGDMLQKWVKRHRKCIAHTGEYLEKD